MSSMHFHEAECPYEDPHPAHFWGEITYTTEDEESLIRRLDRDWPEDAPHTIGGDAEQKRQSWGTRHTRACSGRVNYEFKDKYNEAVRAIGNHPALIREQKLLSGIHGALANKHEIEQRLLDLLSQHDDDMYDPDSRELGCLCQGCGQRFRGNLLVPNSVWEQIKPEGAPEGGGVLCPNCIMDRALDLGIWTAALATAPAGEVKNNG